MKTQTIPAFFRYISGGIWISPPEDDDAVESELTEIRDKLIEYPYRKWAVIEEYLNKQKWIKLYLFFDADTEKEIQKIKEETSKSKRPAAEFQKRVIQRVDDEAKKYGGIIPYFKDRFDHRQTEYDKRVTMQSDDEDMLLYFLDGLSRKIKEIERIESVATPPRSLTSLSPSSVTYKKLEWISDNSEFERHIKILKEKGIIDSDIRDINNSKKINIIADEADVCVICLFKYWEDHQYIATKRNQWKRIADSFTRNHKAYQIVGLKTLGNRMIHDDAIKPHSKYGFFSQILKKNKNVN